VPKKSDRTKTPDAVKEAIAGIAGSGVAVMSGPAGLVTGPVASSVVHWLLDHFSGQAEERELMPVIEAAMDASATTVTQRRETLRRDFALSVGLVEIDEWIQEGNTIPVRWLPGDGGDPFNSSAARVLEGVLRLARECDERQAWFVAQLFPNAVRGDYEPDDALMLLHRARALSFGELVALAVLHSAARRIDLASAGAPDDETLASNPVAPAALQNDLDSLCRQGMITVGNGAVWAVPSTLYELTTHLTDGRPADMKTTAGADMLAEALSLTKIAGVHPDRYEATVAMLPPAVAELARTYSPTVFP
jgi:hypothetical protein